MLLAVPTIDRNGHWPVVDQGDLHVGSKLACGYVVRAKLRAHRLDERFVERDGLFRTRSADEGGAVPFLRVRMQGELAHNKCLATGVF